MTATVELWTGKHGDPNCHHIIIKNKFPKSYCLPYLQWVTSRTSSTVEWFWKKKKDQKGDFSYFEDTVSSALLFVLWEYSDGMWAARFTAARHSKLSHKGHKRTNISFWGCIFSNTMSLLVQLFLCLWIGRFSKGKQDFQSEKGKKKRKRNIEKRKKKQRKEKNQKEKEIK